MPPEISALEVELHCDSELELEQLKRQNAQSTQQLRELIAHRETLDSQKSKYWESIDKARQDVDSKREQYNQTLIENERKQLQAFSRLVAL